MGTSGDYLLIRTCREMYNGHQTNLTIQLNMETMQASFNVPGYASHSLNQFIKVDKDNKIASVDVGDFYSRGLILNVYDGNLSKGVCGSRIGGARFVRSVLKAAVFIRRLRRADWKFPVLLT